MSPFLVAANGQAAVTIARMRVADSHRQRVRRVVRSGYLLQVKQNPDHLLNLFLLGLAVACDGQLDLHGCVFVDGNTRAGGGDNRDTTRLGRTDGSGGVAAEKQLFHDKAISPMTAVQFSQGLVNGQQTFGEGGGGICLDDAVIEHLEPFVLIPDHTEACDGITGINPQYDHLNTSLVSRNR